VPDPDYPDYPNEVSVLKSFRKKLDNGEILKEDGEPWRDWEFEIHYGIEFSYCGHSDFVEPFLTVTDKGSGYEVGYAETLRIGDLMLTYQERWVKKLKAVAEFIGYPMEKFDPGWYLTALYW
jgi:hypothetical protein